MHVPTITGWARIPVFTLLIMTFSGFQALAQDHCDGKLIEDKPDGLWTCYADKDKTVLLSETNYVEGELEGEKKEYYANGQLRFHAFYKAGLLDGIIREYYESGNLKYEGSFTNGNATGKHKELEESGTVSKQHDF